MMTNTYKPHVGGVANSVATFKEALTKRGERCLVVAPHFDNEEEEDEVLRVNALQNFNGSDFSVSFPAPTLLSDIKASFSPDIVHSHHPFLLGNSALRISALENIPIVFTHHTLYERYTHYIPGDSKVLQDLAVKLSVAYANLCSCVIAPSESIRDLLIERGVHKEIRVIPTGIDVESFHTASLDRALHEELGIGEDDFVIGHVSRLANEKNQHFLCRCVAAFLAKRENAKFLLIGDGDIREELGAIFREEGVQSQVIFIGVAKSDKLKKLYKRMDLFAFTSTSETQGMVIAEALSASTPVVALAASGVSEIVKDGNNGILLEQEKLEDFVDAFEFFYRRDLGDFQKRAFQSVQSYSIEACTRALQELYQTLIDQKSESTPQEDDLDIFSQTLRVFKIEYDIAKSKIKTVLPSTA
jgi:glycosyltransferase involved in cell wall biosynthesis